MGRNRRKIVFAWLAVLLIAMAGLAACGEKAPEQQAAGTGTDSGQQPAEQQPAASKEASAETRVVQDAYGDVTIPAHPQRVAAIYQEDFLLALGVTPIVQWYHPAWGKQDYLGLDVPPFDITGSMEALIAANPDLIIVDGGADKEKYEQYSKGAPTYKLPDELRNDTIGRLKKIADLLGIPEKGFPGKQRGAENSPGPALAIRPGGEKRACVPDEPDALAIWRDHCQYDESRRSYQHVRQVKPAVV